MSFCVHVVTYMLVIICEIQRFKNTLDLIICLPPSTEIRGGGLDIGMLGQASEVNESFTVSWNENKPYCFRK